jgi:RNA polymerase sigma factor (sigma-70 family)
MRKRRLQGGADDGEPWADDYVAHRSRLARLVGRFVRPHEIEDIVQETFVRSYAASRKQTIANPIGFMFRTAKNLALNAVDRASVKLNRPLQDCLEADIFVDTETPESQCEAQQEFLAFCEAVALLPVSCRRVFILRKVYGLSQKEIAARLGISASTVEKHITRGMAVTAQSMFDRGYSIGRYQGSIRAARKSKDEPK